MKSDLVIGMAGAGGDGVVSAGEAMMTAAALEGYSALLTKSFGPQIRGGESSCRVRISTQPVLSAGGTLDVAIALNWDDFLKFGSELAVDGRTTVIYEAASGVPPGELPLAGVVPREAIPVPIAQLAKTTAGTDRAKNSVVVGLLAGWLGMRPDAFLAGIRKRFAKKSEEVLKGNEAAFHAGLRHAGEHPLREPRRLEAPRAAGASKLVVDGNDMCAAAAIFAGCEFFGGYPITPSSEIMQFFGREVWKYGGTMLQAEDEIAGIGAVVGASFAGKKALTATSGPGMSLKTEMLGLATIAELPLVCVNVQRGGPSTGIPTKSEQSDLFQACFSAHGDVLRPVLAPISVADTFGITVEAFNVAEHYQTPVILLSDQEIAQRKETVDPIDTSKVEVVERRRPTAAELDGYQRFQTTDSGISPISHPGMPGGNYLASGIEHNERRGPRALEREAARQARAAETAARPVSDRGRPEGGARRRRLGERGRRGARGRPAGAAGGHRREAAGAEAALPGGRGDLRRVLQGCRERAGGGAVAPGPALPSAADVRGSAARHGVARPQRLGADPALGDRRGTARAGAHAAGSSGGRSGAGGLGERA
jgi:2-oxoglutarate ferredoxin oxidoreductase subunit alpha